MKKLFRWGGLIGFIVFTAVTLLIGFFFLDNWVKAGIEAAGTSANGAEVNVGDVDVTLSPLGFLIENVEVADAEKLTHNAVEFGRIELAINFPQLFLGNVRIESLQVSDIQTNVERATPATAVVEDAVEATGDESATGTASNSAQSEQQPSQISEAANNIVSQLPSASSIVNDFSNNSRAAIANAEDVVAQSKQSITASINELPGDDELASYRQQINAIRNTNLNSLEKVNTASRQLQTLTDEAGNDQRDIIDVRRSIDAAVDESETAIRDIAGSPNEDWQALRAANPFNAEGAVKVAELLLGEDFVNRVEQAQYWYGKARPWLARLKTEDDDEPSPERLDGQYIHFYHPDPTARFQLDYGLLSFELDSWPWQLELQDITSKQTDGTRPTQLLLQRGEEDQVGFSVSGLLDQIDGQQVDTYEMVGNGVRFASRNLSLSDTSVSWVPSPADISGEVVSVDGELDGEILMQFPRNEFTATGGSLGSYLNQALSNVQAFNVVLDISGTATRPSINVRSNLDNQLNNAIADIARGEYEAWLADVREELDNEVARLRAPVDDGFDEVTELQETAEARIDQFQNEVVAEIEALVKEVEAEQKRLENAARDAVENAVEDAVKDEAENLIDRISF